MKSSIVHVPQFRICRVTFENDQVLRAKCFADHMNRHFVKPQHHFKN